VHPGGGRWRWTPLGLPGLRAVAVRDGWSPYWSCTQATHALYNAHHLRELDAVAVKPGQG
jgi:transposase